MKKVNFRQWVPVSLLTLFIASFSYADLCTDQGGRLREGHCLCGAAPFDPANHHCIGAALYPGRRRSCSVCMEGVVAGKLTVSCSAGHEAEEGECLEGLVNQAAHHLSEEDKKKAKQEGFKCPHGNCPGRISVEDVERVLGAEKECVKNLKKRLDGSPEEFTTSPGGAAAEAPQDPHVLAVRELKSNVEAAFNLCCPGVSPKGEKCGGILDQIQGCNAATCESCRSTFCYLCLERQADSGVAHAHVRDVHSGNYWEWRDGHTGVIPEHGSYTEVETYNVIESDPMHPGQKRTRRVEVPYTYKDRYHWLLIRKKLDALFQEEKDERVKKEVLTQVEPLLRKNKLWPFPFAKENWIEKVIKDKQIDQRNKIALLQNEYIYQKQLATRSSQGSSGATAAGATDPVSTQAKEKAEAIATKLKELKAPILASLDIPRGGGAADPVNHNVTPLLENHEDEQIRGAFAHLRDHAAAFFAMGGAGGNLYRIHDPEVDPARRVPDFILSHVAPERMNHERAIAYCAERGARLPTKEEYEALGRAMGGGQPGGYNADLIPDMRGRGFWSSSVHPRFAIYAFVFYGDGGLVDVANRGSGTSVRCVAAVPRGEL